MARTCRYWKTTIGTSVPAEKHQILTALAERRGLTVSALLRDMVLAQLPNELRGLEVVQVDAFNIELQPTKEN